MKFIKQNKTPAVYFGKSKAVSFAPSIMKSICALQAWSRFPVKLIVALLLDQHVVFVVHLNLLQLTYNVLWYRDDPVV